MRLHALLRQPAVVLLAGQISTAFVAFAMNILSSNVLAPAERGTLAFFLQVSYVLTTFSLLGVERPYVAARPFTPFPIALREMGTLSRSAWVGAACLGLASIGLALFSETTTAFMTVVAGIYMLANVAIRRIRIAYIASGTIRPFAISTLGTQGLLLAGGVTLFLLESTSEVAWFLAYAISGIAAPCVVFLSVRREPDNAHVASTLELRAIKREGLRLFPASFGNTALVRSDRLLLPFLSSPAELGRYVAVATVMEMGTWPIQQWVDSSLGKWRAQTERRPMNRLVGLAMLGALAVTILVAIVSYLAITYLLPADYAEARALLPALAIGTLLYAGTRIQQGLLIARGRPGAVSIAETVGMVLSVLLYLAMIPAWGGMGAAVASAIGYAIVLVVAVALGRRGGRREPLVE